jgi:large subunit ribosomal protein L4
MELKLINDQGASASTVSAPDTVFGREFNQALVHQIVIAYQANARLGTRKQKERSEIAKSTKKPWRQKGTGRARAGMASSPIWRGGGKIFASSPDENFSQKVNRKMFRAGMASILSQLAREDRIRVVDDLTLDTPKTKLLAQKVKSMGFDGVLVITDEVSENLMLSSRNLNNVEVMAAHHADPVSLVRFPNVLLTKKAMAKLEEMFK